MRKICYHVATTLDGYIAHRDGSIRGIVEDGDHVEDYLSSLQRYDTVIMGRRTYEFGYDFGLAPGERAYPNMTHWIFSKTIDISPADGVHVVRNDWLGKIDQLIASDGPEIYLCGGSVFAGTLLAAGRIGCLRLKVNPVVFGEGLPLFAGRQPDLSKFNLTNTKTYQSGVVLLDYELDAT